MGDAIRTVHVEFGSIEVQLKDGKIVWQPYIAVIDGDDSLRFDGTGYFPSLEACDAMLKEFQRIITTQPTMHTNHYAQRKDTPKPQKTRHKGQVNPNKRRRL